MVESVILATFAILRAGVVIQMVASAAVLCLQREIPTGSLVMLVVATVWSVIYFLAVIRCGSFATSPMWWGVIDLSIAAVSLIVTSAVLPPDWLVGTWQAWQYAFAAVVVPTIPAWMRSRGASIGLGLGIAGIYVATVLPGNTDIAITVVVNSLAYVTFVIATAILCPAARRLAQTADRDRQSAVRLATQLEQAKYRFHIHNVTGLLVQLAHDDTPAELVPSLRAQAVQEANRLRHDVLAPTENYTACETRSLDDVVCASLVGFGQLPIEVRTVLGREVHLNYDESLVLQSALISLLYNVQFHAHASEVVVHADCMDDQWEVSVCDNGVGFDPDNTPYGFGLQSQVLDSAQSKGMTVQVVSQPGEGTCVFIRGCQRANP